MSFEWRDSGFSVLKPERPQFTAKNIDLGDEDIVRNGFETELCDVLSRHWQEQMGRTDY